MRGIKFFIANPISYEWQNYRLFLESKVFLSIDESTLLASEKKRVLVVDDEESVLRPVVIALETNGFEVDTAKTGKEAIEKSKLQRYDAAVIDLRLPDMDGIEILSKANLSNAVKIMFTGYPSLVSGVRAMDKGVDAYLPKPVKPEELVLLVKGKLAERK